MTSPSRNAPPPSYGVESGYSEDYGEAARSKMQPKLDSTEYNATGVYGSATNGNVTTTKPGSTTTAIPVNPFTKQQYQENVTNPFAKK